MEPTAASQGGPAGEQPGRALKVLVVDDNRDAADSLCLLLRTWGYQPRAAYDGAAGLEAAYADLPDCLLLDIGLPHLDGYTLARRVRQHPQLARAKLVALSAYSDETHARRAREAGFDHQFVKPANLSELKRILDMLNEVIRLATQTEELARQNVSLATETKELLKEVKEDIKEVKAEVKELKEELRDVKEKSEGQDEAKE
jgi:two-component system, OmpR family, response regulator